MSARSLLVLMIMASLFILQASGETNAENLTLEDRVLQLEEELESATRRLEIALSRTTLLLDKVEILNRNASQLLLDVRNLRRLALPSEPSGVRVERIRRTDAGYRVKLSWKANPEREEVKEYEVWYTPKGEPYDEYLIVNQTSEEVIEARIGGFESGEDIVFKIFSRNYAGKSPATYAEAVIRGYAPNLIRISVAGGVLLVIVAGLFLAWRKEIIPKI